MEMQGHVFHGRLACLRDADFLHRHLARDRFAAGLPYTDRQQLLLAPFALCLCLRVCECVSVGVRELFEHQAKIGEHCKVPDSLPGCRTPIVNSSCWLWPFACACECVSV